MTRLAARLRYFLRTALYGLRGSPMTSVIEAILCSVFMITTPVFEF